MKRTRKKKRKCWVSKYYLGNEGGVSRQGEEVPLGIYLRWDHQTISGLAGDPDGQEASVPPSVHVLTSMLPCLEQSGIPARARQLTAADHEVEFSAVSSRQSQGRV